MQKLKAKSENFYTLDVCVVVPEIHRKWVFDFGNFLNNFLFVKESNNITITFKSCLKKFSSF